ncbi:hypothetical protein R3W88_019350 [Solanum pinnatisectum]|uniref:Uncharacterized protein n=1 Tax=Solanum pinnatisectum TaxID=50273 RepID=A0AAV9KKM4_9SOLN|nr:hypothetical protein R3W88_019350 [Solanum pinnatisectum]
MVPAQEEYISKVDKGRADGSINKYERDKHGMELVRHQQHQSDILQASYQEPLVSGASVNYCQCKIPTIADKLEHVVPKISHQIPREETSNSTQGSIKIAEGMHS